MFRFFKSVFVSRFKNTPAKRTSQVKARRRFQPGVESLEARTVPAAAIVSDIFAGPDGSAPSDLVVNKDAQTKKTVVFFAADDGMLGRELWKSDGTNAGTVKIKDIYPGTAGSDPRDLTVVGNFVYFTADDGVHGRELWRTNGQTSNTQMVRDINPGVDASDPSELTLVRRNGKNFLYFAADDGIAHGRELWRNTLIGNLTQIVSDINLGSADSSPTYLTVTSRSDNQHLFFRADDGRVGAELWRSFGNGAKLVQDIRAGADGSSPFNLTLVSSRINGKPRDVVYFGARDDINGAELWRTVVSPGGATGSPHLVKDINPGPADSLQESSIALMTEFRDQLFFAATDGLNHGRELWRTNPTNNRTALVHDINPGSADSNPTMQEHPLPERRALIVKSQKDSKDLSLFFGADDGFRGGELWVTTAQRPRLNGRPAVPAQTLLFTDLDHGPGSGLAGNELIGIVSGKSIFFAASDGPQFHNRELFSTPGASLFQDINTGTAASNPLEFVGVGKDNNVVFFVADNGFQGKELWRLRLNSPGSQRAPGQRGSVQANR